MSIFNAVLKRKPKKSVFDLSHDVKLTATWGRLIPVLCEPCVPGDKWRINTEMHVRLAPMLAPIMHRIDVTMHYFFVPNRLIWDDFQKFITGGEDGTEEVAFPTFRLRQMADNGRLDHGQLADYFGVQTYDVDDRPLFSEGELVSALPFRAYQLIYNQYYRDQNLEDEIDIHSESNGILPFSQMSAMTQWRSRAWRKDYFTSALPWVQRGPAVRLPMSGDAPITDLSGNNPGLRGVRSYDEDDRTHDNLQMLYGPEGDLIGSAATANNTIHYDPQDQSAPNSLLARGQKSASDAGTLYRPANINLNSTNQVDLSDLQADLRNVNAATINELRRASRLQEWLETNARGGSRYIEQIFAHFGVKSSDSRLQRAEFLGGSVSPVVIGEVLQTSAAQSDSAQANPAGVGSTLSSGRVVKKFIEEHGYIIGLLSIRPTPAYATGMKKDLFKFDRFDFFFPEFAQLGEQPILRKELFLGGDDEKNEEVFGYTPRYAEYKYIPNSVHGDFRTPSLATWHLARFFNDYPNLNANFVHVRGQEQDLERIFAVETQLGDNLDHFWVNLHHNIRAVRPMPKYNVPML